MAISIRTLSDTDLESVNTILKAAFQRPDSWLRELSIIRNLQSAVAFSAHYHGVLAGVVFSTQYPDFTYVGPLGVHPEFQRLGIGFALMEHLLGWLDTHGIMRVALDASPNGQFIYEKLGFKACDQVSIFQRQSGGSALQQPDDVQRLSLQNLNSITATDKHIFGTDRSKLLGALLRAFPKRGFVLSGGDRNISGYIFAQDKIIGPWVAKKHVDASLLLQAALSLSFDYEPVSVVVPNENISAPALLQSYGFKRVRVLRHMVRGSKIPAGQREMMYGQTSPSLG